MSVRAADMVARIRGDGGGGGAPFVMISGARTSTIIQRLPYLPTPDAVATENGGRLFFADAARKTCLPLREDLAWRARHDDMAGVLLVRGGFGVLSRSPDRATSEAAVYMCICV